jgi:hypothetical protein
VTIQAVRHYIVVIPTPVHPLEKLTKRSGGRASVPEYYVQRPDESVGPLSSGLVESVGEDVDFPIEPGDKLYYIDSRGLTFDIDGTLLVDTRAVIAKESG